MGRQPRTKGAQVYCTSSPGDRQHQDGADDLRVPLPHGIDFRAALDKYGKPYECVLYDHEGHGFNRDENVFDFIHRVEKFLAKYLGVAPAQASAN
jgi:Prolyl oligopeptidase family